jgi:hypothetical protein
MAPDAKVVLLTFPARQISPDERKLVREWFALAGDIAAAYTSDRRSDDPALYRHIVVVDNPHGRPTFLIHQPAGLTMWIKTVVRRKTQVETFETLRAALNSIRQVLDETAR